MEPLRNELDVVVHFMHVYGSQHSNTFFCSRFFNFVTKNCYSYQKCIPSFFDHFVFFFAFFVVSASYHIEYVRQIDEFGKNQSIKINGAIGYLPKPCTVDGVKEVLKHAMGHGSMFSPIYQESWDDGTSCGQLISNLMHQRTLTRLLPLD